MSAIAGIKRLEKITSTDQLEKMCKSMIRRGPDYHDVTIFRCMAMGLNGLFLDVPERRDYPLFEDNTIILALGGEVFNKKDLKNQLKTELHTAFNADNMPELLARYYAAGGIKKLLQAIDGSFSLAIYDKKQELLFIARDKFGVKPLFYSIKNNAFSFASELKAFSPNLKEYSLNKEALNYFLSLCYIPAPYTIYNEIKKVRPGEIIEVDKNLSIRILRYFNLKDNIGVQCTDSFTQAKQKVKEKLENAVKIRMCQDYTTGSLLSGGIDSSVISTLAAQKNQSPINTFSIGFEEAEYDESERANIVAKAIQSNHFSHILKCKDMVHDIDSIIEYYDEPFGDSSALPCTYVACLAKKYQNVVLTGDCADEIFAGYSKYLGRYYADKLKKLPRPILNYLNWMVRHCPVTSWNTSILRQAQKALKVSKMSDFDIYYNLMCLGFKDEQREMLLEKSIYTDIKTPIQTVYNECPSKDCLNKEQYCDFHYVLEGDMFTKIDRATMFHSVENRAPFLSEDLVTYAFTINPMYKLKGKNKKYILKEAFRDILPKKTLNFSKKGFGVPVDYWLKNELKNDLLKLTSKDFITKQGIFHYNVIAELVKEHLDGHANHKFLLWNIYVFQKWYLKNCN